MLLSVVTISVENLQTATRYYESLGHPVRRDSSGVVHVEGGQTRLALHPRRQMENYIGTRLAAANDPKQSPPITLSSNLSSAHDVDRMFARAEECGATLIRRPGPIDWGGYIAWVRSPDGVLWEFVFNPNYQ